MINPNNLLDLLEKEVGNFITGVPDSQLKPFCQEIVSKYGYNNEHHIVGANEGNSVALAAGYYLATKKVPVVYLQNSGLGNIVNPVASLTDPFVYGIPVIYFVGWRGEPGIKDEPQHKKQGLITLELLETIGIKSYILDKSSTIENINDILENDFASLKEQGKSIAFVVKKGAFDKSEGSFPKTEALMTREYAISTIADKLAFNDFVVSSTGKISRELFEHQKNENPKMNSHNFLTVGCMGHASSIALSIALNSNNRRTWCFDGDGAVLMHMGSLATIGTIKPSNFIHIVFNNSSHESVGGMPTVANKINLCDIAKACGYKKTFKIESKEELKQLLSNENLEKDSPILLEVIVSTGSRLDLIRPDSTPEENKEAFMKELQNA